MNEYIFSTHEGVPAVINTRNNNEVVFYINDIKPDVIANCLNIYNRLQSTKEVEEYLLDEDDCDADQREFIIEQLAQYAFLNTVTPTATIIPIIPTTMEENKVIDPTAGMTIPGSVSEPGSPAPQENPTAPVEKTKRPWTRRITDGNPAIKAQSTADFIKVMQEKIEMAKILDTVVLPELPGSMTKANRDIMVEFVKEHSQLVMKYMQKIQQA
jgi:hypothetical protein